MSTSSRGILPHASSVLAGSLLGVLLLPVQGLARQAAYLDVVSVHFSLPAGEARLLVEEGLVPEELPVVMVLARERGVAPTVVVSRRHRGADRVPWTEVARQMGLGPGVFHVEVDPREADDTIRRALELFDRTPRERWHALDLRDDEVVSLANLRVLSRSLRIETGALLEARAASGSWPRAVERLVGRSDTP